MKVRSSLLNVFVLVAIGALAYLPLINRIGYTHDDWYLMWSAKTNGASVFHPIYSVDRPLRAYVLEAEYAVFGESVLLYNLSAWVLRVASALLFLWWLGMLWPNQSRWTFLMSLLYLIYPGFLSQQNGIDYQSQILSLALAMLSLGLTVHAFSESRLWLKIFEIMFAIVLGVIYLGLVEYEAGFELIRFLILFILVGRVFQSYRDRMIATMKAWLPYSLIVFGFGFWRFFIFKGERSATDVNIQFEQVQLYPIQTIYHWMVQVVQDMFDVILNAWTIPLSQLIGYVERWGTFVAIAAVVLVLFAFMKEDENGLQRELDTDTFSAEALWFGFLSAAAGLIPIAMVNREVAFPSFSRYALVSSVGVAIFWVGLLMHLRGRYLRSAVLAGLVLIAVLTHHANSVKFADETAALQNFWWQISWRVPQLAARTTLMGMYPVGGIEEDYFLWGPASLIYFPEKAESETIGPTLFAAVLNKDTVTKVLAKERQEFDNRKNIITYKNYRNILILSQPTVNSCVHVINGQQPEFSQWEPDSIRVIGSYSELEHVLASEAPHTPPAIVFGSEPKHGWCYYYQKADLARQRGDWDEVMKLADEALGKKLTPNDSIEWIPFLQAYAQAGDIEHLTELAPKITSSPYVAGQACQILRSMPDNSVSVLETINSVYCTE